MLERLRPFTCSAAGFPDPRVLVLAAELDLVVGDLPAGCFHATNGSTIIYAWHHDQRERGTRIFMGLARAAIGGRLVRRDEVCALAARLAAPAMLIRRIGVEASIARQPWATAAFLREWCDTWT